MDTPSESYRLFPLSHLPAFSLDALPFTNEQLDEAGLLGEGESLSHFAHLSHTYFLPCRRFPVRLTDIADDGEFLSLFPHLNHTYHFAFRFDPVHAPVH
jgi:hypothetical protein